MATQGVTQKMEAEANFTLDDLARIEKQDPEHMLLEFKLKLMETDNIEELAKECIGAAMVLNVKLKLDGKELQGTITTEK